MMGNRFDILEGSIEGEGMIALTVTVAAAELGSFDATT